MKIWIPTLAALPLLLLQGCHSPEADARPRGGVAAFFSQGGSTVHAGVVAPDSVVTVTRPFPVNHEEGTVSRDGAWWATTDWNTGDIVVRGIDGTEERRVTGNPAPYVPGFGMEARFSPDGAEVAYTWYDYAEDRAGVQVGAVDGSGVRTVYRDPALTWIHVYDWSPDGRQLLALLHREDGTFQLALVPADGSSPTVLRSLGWSQPLGAAFSPDGRWVAFDLEPDEDRRSRDLQLLSVDGSEGRALAEGLSDDWLLGWSPEGFLLFLSDRGGTPGAWRIRMENGRAAAPPELVQPDLWRVFPAGFDERGRLFYFRMTGGPEVQLAGLDLEGGRFVGPWTPVDPRAPGPTRQAAWSPDGRHLAYLVDHGSSRGTAVSQQTLRVRALEGGEIREYRMPPLARGLANPRWAPDGRSIFLRSQYDRGATSLLRLNLQTGDVVRVLRDVPLYPVFELLPDGRRIVHTEALPDGEVDRDPDGLVRGRRLVVRDLEDGTVRELHRHQASVQNGSLVLWRLALSPDGERVAFTRTQEWGATPEGSAELVVMPVDGGEPRRIADGLAPMGVGLLAWTPDGDGLLYGELHAPEGAEEGQPMHSTLWHIDLAGGQRRELARFDHGLGHLRPHADGRRIAFGTGSVETELWVMEDIAPVQPRTEASGSR